MLEVLRRSRRWLMGAVIVVVGGVFVAYLGLGGGGRSGSAGGQSLVQLDDRRYSLLDLQRIREDQERRLRESMGEAFDGAAAGAYLDQFAAEQMIQRAVLAAEAERLGLRASDDEVRQLVRTVFRSAEGRIDGAAARDYAVRRFGSEARFAQEVRDDILTTKLLQLIDAGAKVSDAEARDAVRYRREQVRIAYVALDPETPPANLEATDAEVDRALAEEAPRIRAFYDEHPDRYHLPERVRARHILIQLPADAPEDKLAEARGRAEQALERIRKGEDFAAVAREVSEDPGSKEQGGDLGLFPRGQMALPFEEVAFGLEPGKTSEVVRSDFGFHVIRVEAREPAQDTSFEAASRAIAAELVRTDKARALARDQADRLAAAVRGGQSLTDAARTEGLTIERPDWTARRPDGLVEGLGPAPEVLTAAFAITPERATSERVFDVDGKRVMIELLERRGPTPEELATEVAAERAKLVDSRRSAARNEWLRAARERLQAEGRLAIDLTPIQRAVEAPKGES